MRIEKLSADANYLNIGQDFFGLALVKLCKTSMEETWSDYWGSLRTGPNMLHAIFHLSKKKTILESAECSAIFLENLAWNFREGHHVNCRTGWVNERETITAG